MKPSIIEARVVRSGLPVVAGKSFRDAESKIIEKLNLDGKSVFIGIENNFGMYTAVGENSVFYSTESGEELEVSNSDFRESLRKYSFAFGKTGVFDFIPIDKDKKIWVKDGPTMNALWNIVLMFVRRK